MNVTKLSFFIEEVVLSLYYGKCKIYFYDIHLISVCIIYGAP